MDVRRGGHHGRRQRLPPAPPPQLPLYTRGSEPVCVAGVAGEPPPGATHTGDETPAARAGGESRGIGLEKLTGALYAADAAVTARGGGER